MSTTRSTGTHAVSRDGTRIHYRQTGNGPGVLLLHGSMQTSRNQSQLAAALAGAFTVTVMDRRGRGESGPYGADYGIGREVEDVAAVLAATGARQLFGVSAGGLVALEAARTLPDVDRVALYEPALLLAGNVRQVEWLPRFDAELARGRVGAAMVTSMKGLELAPPAVNLIPRRLLEALTNLALRSEDKKAGPGDVTMRMLAPTLHYEGRLLAEMRGTLDSFREVSAEVLLLGGSKGLPFIKPALDALERVLPHVTRVELPGLDHGGSSDVTPANRGAHPAAVAAHLSRFFVS
jgi:pimeloyl-ACP methyl ester carboxylesterase